MYELGDGEINADRSPTFNCRVIFIDEMALDQLNGQA